MNILITGGASILGRNLALHLQQNNHTVYIIDIDTYDTKHFDPYVIQNDITIPGMLNQLCTDHKNAGNKFDVIVHLAEINTIDPAMSTSAIRTNVCGTAEVLRVCALNNIRGVIGVWHSFDVCNTLMIASLAWKQTMVHYYDKGNIVINEVLIPNIIHPMMPSSNFESIVNRIYDHKTFGNLVVIEPGEFHTQTVDICNINSVITAIEQTINIRTRKLQEVHHSTITFRTLVGYALDIFNLNQVEIYSSKQEPTTYYRINPKNSCTAYELIKEEWHEYI